MNGNEPVKSLYTTPLFLFANTLKQNTFAMDSSSSNPIKLGLCNASHAGPWYSGGCWNSGKTCGKRTGTTGMGAMPILSILWVVLRIPWCGLFICLLAVAGLGLRYLSIKISLIFRQPIRNPCHVALSSVEIFGLHNDWCANLIACRRPLGVPSAKKEAEQIKDCVL